MTIKEHKQSLADIVNDTNISEELRSAAKERLTCLQDYERTCSCTFDFGVIAGAAFTVLAVIGLDWVGNVLVNRMVKHFTH